MQEPSNLNDLITQCAKDYFGQEYVLREFQRTAILTILRYDSTITSPRTGGGKTDIRSSHD